MLSFGIKRCEQGLPATPTSLPQHTKAPYWGLVHILSNVGKAPKWEITP